MRTVGDSSELVGITMESIKWVRTVGGPLIVIPVEIAHHWRGARLSVVTGETWRRAWRQFRRTPTMDEHAALMSTSACRKCPFGSSYDSPTK